MRTGGIVNFIFLFEEKKDQKGTAMEIDGSKKKTATIKLINFKNVLGSGTTKKIKIIETDDGKSVYFSLYAKSLTIRSIRILGLNPKTVANLNAIVFSFSILICSAI